MRENNHIRKTVLERDEYECQLSEMFGIAHLSGMPCVEELEVHHKTYVRYGDEIGEDLITVCRRCHDFLTSYIRGLRFSRLNVLNLEDTSEVMSGVRQKENENEDPDFRDTRNIADDFPQRTIKRSTLRVD